MLSRASLRGVHSSLHRNDLGRITRCHGQQGLQPDNFRVLGGVGLRRLRRLRRLPLRLLHYPTHHLFLRGPPTPEMTQCPAHQSTYQTDESGEPKE